MSLGVLNNLNSIYAENSLNNTSNSLSKVLNQLSSGSKINSGADDAAGLSLVDGLQANQMALTQSETNATEGVGLLTVADGALSQVTNLLNRAVTLATEASNGTLNSSQDTAANQEYQSILSEISNIGSTTTYNQEQVFNSNTAIYTGDSTTSGASVDDLNIRSLSSANVGDTSGQMSYSSGNAGSNVFVDLTGGGSGTLAALGDNLTGGQGGQTAITINTLSSTGTTVANTITTGGNSGFANTAQGMINAINASGLGVTASFTTAAVAGDKSAAASTDTGIMITGSVGSGTSPSATSFSGSIAASGVTTAGADKLTGSITLQEGTGAATTITMAQVAAAANVSTGAVNMTELASYITADAGLGVTASVNNNGGLSLASGSAATPTTDTLKVNSDLIDNSITSGPTTLNYTATSAYSVGVTTPGTTAAFGIEDTSTAQVENVTQNGSLVAFTSAPNTAQTVATLSVDSATTPLSGTLVITGTEGAATGVKGITAGGVIGAAGGNITLGVAGKTDNLADLAAYINSATEGDGGAATSNMTATVSGNTLVIAEAADASATADGTVTLTGSPVVTPDGIDSGTATTGNGTATISYTDKAGTSLSGTDLTNQADAETTLTTLNLAITNVAAQDGYLGAQINTLNSVASVLSTQSENVTAAQNAVQATDYASATSNMSKYQILSQTGIAALAQANSMQQEVTKLLQ
jgi:flagellin